MKKFIILVILGFISESITAQTVLLKAKGYVDVRSGKLINPANILIEDGLIKSINPSSEPENITIMDLGEKILMPGMMDMHVHLDMDFDDGYEKRSLTENGSKGTLRAAKNAELTLMAGFTTIRNVGQLHPTLELIGVAVDEASKEGWVNSPRIFDCGHFIGISGGHGDLSMEMGLAEGIMELGPEYGMVNSVDDAIKATRFQIKHGAKAIKITATAGVLSLEETVGAQQLSNAEMKAIVEEANRHHITVAAHAHGTEGIKAAIAAGVRSIEHGSLLDEEGFRMMKEMDAFLVPTSGLYDIVLNNIERIDPIMQKKAKFIVPKAKSNLGKAIKAGVKIALGTDAPLVPHGQNAIELTAMMAQGMTTKEALRTATINPAELLYLKDRGEIKAGLLADIIAVDENPLDNIQTLENVKFVMKGGVVYKNE